MKNTKTIIFLTILLLSVSLHAQNEQITDAFEQSYIHENAEQYDLAISDLQAVYLPSSYEINLRLGWLHYLADKTKASIEYYKKSAEILPAATEPLWAVITVYNKLENWVAIEKAYLSILKLDAKNTTANYQLGLIYYYRKDFIKAKKYFDVSLNLIPFNYNYLLMSGWTNYFLGNKNNASILFHKVLLYSPKDTSALEGLSLLK
ncbi:hypothetical protein K8354_02985 [Polaribacter litorisediminis]|uniref:tetratricopeptide repeat protein n=1 Tax=Polaribacter litorisediminis TaxID=1908341 RepID=UPI001CBEE8FC|nr:hypothetical protein [Polaribacter litorisediminis]UAM98808.1 hypothetical protein K8354_02985 [Polaribacter litorisediminis]